MVEQWENIEMENHHSMIDQLQFGFQCYIQEYKTSSQKCIICVQMVCHSTETN